MFFYYKIVENIELDINYNKNLQSKETDMITKDLIQILKIILCSSKYFYLKF